jgi:transposase
LDDKKKLLDEAARPGETVSSIGRRYGLSVSLLFRWRRQISGDAARKAKAPVDAAARQPDEVRRLREQVRELQRLLGKKTLEIEVLRSQLRHGEPAPRGTPEAVAEPARREPLAATPDGRA